MLITVVGAGVVGLSTAIRLLEEGHDVVIRARERTPGTTSDAAAAVYFPYRAYPPERVIPWARRTLTVLEELAKEAPSGVVLRELVAVEPKDTGRPWWNDLVPAYRAAEPHELPPWGAHGFVLRVPTIEMPTYMAYLESRAASLGARFECVHLRDLPSARGDSDVVVNCSGLGARELARDPEVHPLRGQVVRVENPGLERALLDETSPRALAYIIPRRGDVVLGGTCEAGREDLTPDEAQERGILDKCIEAEPRLRGARILSRAVALRPARRTIRLEADVVDGVPVVHNYGHGGSGVTLSWGCAEEAVGLVGAVARRGRIVVEVGA